MKSLTLLGGEELKITCTIDIILNSDPDSNQGPLVAALL